MKDKEGRGLGDRAVNGHKSSKDFLTGASLGLSTGPNSKETADREATRYLSAATQLDIDYARNVVDRMLNEQIRALAPTFGVDIPVVVKWALKALRTRSVRDRSLSVILALQIFLMVVLIVWWPWVWIFVVSLCAAAWMVVSWDYHERINRVVIGKMLRDRFEPTSAPPPSEADRERLDVVARRREGNLVVFSGHDAFIGTGRMLYSQRLLLDISSRRDDENSDRRSVDFTSHDLQAAIVAAFDRDRGLGKTLDNIRVHERLFVNGLHIQKDGQLLPSPQKPPPASVDSTLLRAASLNPSPEARTYVCVEIPGWQGQLVVTLFIRVVYTGKSLFVEWTFRVLPPIREQFRVIDHWYERPGYLQLKDSLGFGLRSMIPALLASPVHAFKLWHKPRVARRNESRYKRAIQGGRVFDYGAGPSIREDASGVQRHHYFLARDEGMYVLLAQQTLIQTVQDFLSDHGIDLGQFKDQVKVIFDQSINYNIGDISDSTGIAIGHNSSAKVNDSPKESK